MHLKKKKKKTAWFVIEPGIGHKPNMDLNFSDIHRYLYHSYL